jgi:hypothetical protein
MSKKNTDKANKATDTLAGIAQNLYGQTDPIRQALIGRSAAFLGAPTSASTGRFGITSVRDMRPGLGRQMQQTQPLDVTQSPMYGTLKNAIDSQFKLATDNTIARTAPGGQLSSALSGLEGQKASAMASGIGGLAQDELARAYGLATGGAQMSTSGLASAGAIQAQIAAAQAQRDGAAKQGIGQGAGQLAGAKAGGGGCWVAEALYGEFDHRTLSIRRLVLFRMNDKSLFGWFCRLYSAYGEAWANGVRRNAFARLIARLVWNALYRASKKHGA